MPRPLTPAGYMTKKRKLSLYDENLKYLGERMVYEYRGNYYITRQNNKAYQVGLKQIGGSVFAMLKPNGNVLS